MTTLKYERDCSRCPALCCQYFSLEIDEPENRTDIENLRWYIMHENTFVYIDEDEWFLLINQRCKHLQENYTCGIWGNHPDICKEYGVGHKCEMDHIQDGKTALYDQFFSTERELWDWYEKHIQPAEDRKKKARRKRSGKDKKEKKQLRLKARLTQSSK